MTTHNKFIKSRKLVIFLYFLTGACLVLLLSLCYNNISLKSDRAFSAALDTAIQDGIFWAVENKNVLMGKDGSVNIALLRMLQDCNQLRYTPVFDEIIKAFLSGRSRPQCWKALLDPAWPIDKEEINRVAAEEIIDYKWALYAIAPDKVSLNPQELGLFEPDRWNGRRLTHQLWALIILRERTTPDKNRDELIEHLCNRLTGQLRTDIAVVDIYIQKAAFVLKAGHPEKINIRWVERIIENQNKDGGWDDRWFVLTSGIRPGFAKTTSNQHATAQALWLLYQVRYRYPELFNVRADE